jgi:hypothetical protein
LQGLQEELLGVRAEGQHRYLTPPELKARTVFGSLGAARACQGLQLPLGLGVSLQTNINVD